MTSRRTFLGSVGVAATVMAGWGADGPPAPLQEFRYQDVTLAPGPAQAQFEQTQSILMGLNEDSLLKPWRLRAGLRAPGQDLGGWYDELPLEKTESGGHGFAPGHCFGQWLSALARGYAAGQDSRTRAKLTRLLELYQPAISGRFYTNFRFPAYNYDKLVIGLLDAHTLAGLSPARDLLQQTTDAAVPHLPPHALDRDEPQRRWRESVHENTTNDYLWDESYTLPENLYLAAERGLGDRYRDLAGRYLLNETYFDPLSENRDVLGGHHAYSFCNALNSAMMAYLSTGSQKHLKAASNAFDMITTTQSFATGGWGPNESFGRPGSDSLYKSLTGTHNGFETPCGSYAHAKLTRYLLRVTRDGRYGDSLERVLYNTVLGAKPLQADGRSFYYADYHAGGRKVFFPDAWPCCAGTLTQIAADYRILTYFRDPDDGGVYVNLYLPSTLRWISHGHGAQLALTQTGEYPLAGKVQFQLRASRPSLFALRLRIPAFATSPAPRFRLNGQTLTGVSIQKGFASVNRTWKDGDRLEMELAMPARLEPISAAHPNTVALVKGPLVQFATGTPAGPVSRARLLSADGLTLRPFMALHDEPYTAYFTLAE